MKREIKGQERMKKAEECAKAYRSGKTTPQIAKEYGISKTTVGVYLKLVGVEVRPATANLTNQVFGNLTAVSQATTVRGETRWNCVCSCGNRVVVFATHLNSGHSTKCQLCSTGVSQSEKIFLDGLERLIGEKIERQIKLNTSRGPRWFDGKIESKKLFIECNGKYWHYNEEALQNDKFKWQCAKEVGYDVLPITIDTKKDAIRILKQWGYHGIGR